MPQKFVVTGWDPLVCALLAAAGVVPEMCSRVVLDLEAGKPGMMYLSTYLDKDVLENFELTPKLAAGVVVERP